MPVTQFASSSGDEGDEPLFVFGSLLDDDLLSCVLGTIPGELMRQPAVLPGYRRQRAVGEVFPVLSACAESSVCGGLMSGLSVEHMRRILFYEGPAYELQAIDVLVGRRRTRARVFMATPLLEASRESWELAQWQNREKQLALLIADELMSLYGTVAAGAIEGEKWDAIKNRALARLECAMAVPDSLTLPDISCRMQPVQSSAMA